MKYKPWLAAALLLLLLSGCGKPEEAPSSAAPTLPSVTGQTAPSSGAETLRPEPDSSEPAHTDGTAAVPPETQPGAPTEPVPPATEALPTQPAGTEPAPTEPRTTEPDAQRLAVRSMGLYAGPFPEDGSGEPVDSVAVLLVENPGEVQLQYAELHYLIDGREAVFHISELPPHARVMAVEINRLIAMPVSVWEARTEEDLFVWLAAEPAEGLDVRCEADGAVTVSNRGREAASFDLIYKQRGEDGVFVGGIAYHLRTPALAPGETQTLDAPHFTGQSIVVRVTAKEP